MGVKGSALLWWHWIVPILGPILLVFLAIVFAVGSGGTYAGWLIGTRLLNLPWRLECYSVSREPEQVSIQVARLATEAAQLLQLDWQFNAADAFVHGSFIGAGYGIPSTAAAAEIRLVGRMKAYY